MTLDAQTLSDMFAEIRSTDLRVADVGALKERIGSAIGGMRMNGPFCEPGITVYRGAKLLEREKPALRDRLSYPPDHLANGWGRVTRPGQRVFYCSVPRDAVGFELGLNAGDHVAIGRWRSTAPLMFTQVGFHPGVLHNLGGARAAALRVSNPTAPLSDLDRQIDAFFSEQFCKIVGPGDEHLYKISVAIAEPLFRAGFEFRDVPGYTGAPRVAGLLFPSIATLGNNDNIAFLTEVVDDSLTLEFVEWSRVESVAHERITLTPVDCASSFGPRGEIEWLGRQPRLLVPPGGRHTWAPDGTVIEAFDAAGRRIERS